MAIDYQRQEIIRGRPSGGINIVSINPIKPTAITGKGKCRSRREGRCRAQGKGARRIIIG